MSSTSEISISFIVSTKNRLSYLKILDKHIFSNIQPNEEIIVIDGNSTDGSREYLQSLFIKGIIHQFVSQPDKNQAHGWNKALLLAKGSIIKKITDDDVFDLNVIRKSANWMLKRPEVDFCISDCLQANLANPNEITLASRKSAFLKWKDKETKSFTYSDVYLLIRKSSLSQFGLFDTQFRMIDWEYALRCSYLNAKIAYYTGAMALAVSTPENITSTTPKQVFKREGEIGKLKYEYAGDGAEISLYSKIKIFIGKNLGTLMGRSKSLTTQCCPESQLMMKYNSFYDNLYQYNLGSDFEIIE